MISQGTPLVIRLYSQLAQAIPTVSLVACLLGSTVFSNSSAAYAASGIQSCLEVYQTKADQQVTEVKVHNQKLSEGRLIPPLVPEDFPKMHGPKYYINNHAVSYTFLSIWSFGAVPLVHGCAKLAYKAGVLLTCGIADTTVIPSINLGKKITRAVKTKKVVNPYNDEIELIKDLIQYNEREIIFSERFKAITENASVKKRYPNFKDVYSLLKLTFDKQLPCSDREGSLPIGLADIINKLASGDLAIATGYSDSIPVSIFDNAPSSSKLPPPYVNGQR